MSADWKPTCCTICSLNCGLKVQARMFGCGMRADIEHAKVTLLAGKNPWQSHGFPRAFGGGLQQVVQLAASFRST